MTQTMAERITEFSKKFPREYADAKAFLCEGKAMLTPDTRKILHELGFMNSNSELGLEFTRTFMNTLYASQRGLATSSNL